MCGTCVHLSAHSYYVVCKCRQGSGITFESQSLKKNQLLKSSVLINIWLCPVSVDKCVVARGKKLLWMVSRIRTNSEQGGDRSFFFFFFVTGFYLKTQVPPGSLVFLCRLQLIRESNPWAQFLCLTSRWHCVSQEGLQRVSLKWPKCSSAIHKMAVLLPCLR